MSASSNAPVDSDADSIDSPVIRFWSYQRPGAFIEEKAPQVLSKLPGVTWIPDEKHPDVIEIAYFSSVEPLARYVLNVRRQYGRKPVVYYLSGEGWKFPSAGIDFSFSFQPSAGNNCWRYAQVADDKFEYLLTNRINEHEQLRRWHETEKTRFCNFIYSHPIKIRNDFYKLLARYKPVACPASVLNNMPRLPPYQSTKGISGKLDLMATCKFTIAFENSSVDHYLTEKIYDAFCVNSVPVYWGCPQVAEYYNPEAFINCHDYNSFEEVVERVKAIDNDPELYRKYLNAPPILPTSRFQGMQKEIRHYSEMIVNTALERRKQENSRLKDALYLNKLFWGCFLWVRLNVMYQRSPARFRKAVSRVTEILKIKKIILRFLFRMLYHRDGFRS